MKAVVFFEDESEVTAEQIANISEVLGKATRTKLDLKPRPPISVNITLNMAPGTAPNKVRDAVLKAIDDEINVRVGVT